MRSIKLDYARYFYRNYVTKSFVLPFVNFGDLFFRIFFATVDVPNNVSFIWVLVGNLLQL